jgi:hypothetical protein
MLHTIRCVKLVPHRNKGAYRMRHALMVLLLGVFTPVFAQQQQFGDIGDLKLISGEVLKDCRVGYRTFGKLNADKSNIILYPTWANGRTEQIECSTFDSCSFYLKFYFSNLMVPVMMPLANSPDGVRVYCQSRISVGPHSGSKHQTSQLIPLLSR